MLTDPHQLKEDNSLDTALRPNNLNEYVGQQKIKDKLQILIEAARQRKEKNIEHLLLYGGSGLGKTTLAQVIAKELGSSIKTTAGPTIEKVGDLASVLTNLQEGDILFIDEAHRLNKTVEETLYPAMEDYKLDIIIGKGPSARTLQLDLPPFTLISATTKIGMLSSPFRSRFGVTYHLDFYNENDISQIIQRSANLLKVQIEPTALKLIACCSRHTPRVANRLLKRVRDYCQVKGNGVVDKTTTEKALAMLEIDQKGLEPVDRQLLKSIIKTFNGGPVGLSALAASINEETDTIEDVYEPYLLQLGLLARTGQGRIATNLAYKHLGLKEKQDQLL